LIVNRDSASISAPFGSGVGVGFGRRIGAGGGAPNCGAIFRPGPVCSTGVAVGEGFAVPVWRARPSGCWAFDAPTEAPTIRSEIAANADMTARIAALRDDNGRYCFNLIIDKPSLNKCAMSNLFRGRQDFDRDRDAGEARRVAQNLECGGWTPPFPSFAR